MVRQQTIKERYKEPIDDVKEHFVIMDALRVLIC